MTNTCNLRGIDLSPFDPGPGSQICLQEFSCAAAAAGSGFCCLHDGCLRSQLHPRLVLVLVLQFSTNAAKIQQSTPAAAGPH
jgi:hypothetical protein